MTKAKISEYDAVAANNTDVNGVNIDEGCAPSGMNNMGREIMAALKRFETGADGDSLTVGGNLIVSGTSTVAALNASSTATFAAGAVGTPAITTTGDTNTGIFFPAADTIAFTEGGAEAMRIDSSGNLLLGTTSYESGAFGAGFGMNINNSRPQMLLRNSATTETAYMGIAGNIFYVATEDAIPLAFVTSDTERARITSGGDLLIGKTAISITANGAYFQPNRNAANGCQLGITNTENSNTGAVLTLNRQGSDGDLIYFYQANIEEGGVSVSGSTVSYNGGHLSRWAQMLTKPDLVKGTVMSNLDEMNVYVKPTLYWTEEDELPVDEEGNPTAAVGDVKQETSVSENEQLNKVKVSDVEGDANVAGVFVNWTYDEAHQVDEINMAMTGDMIIRIAQGVTVSRGDLLMSAGDGTAKPQGDDIVRSKTIAKVTSTHVTCTYEDGSYCVPCVLMAC
jgi:hypothetical protein